MKKILLALVATAALFTACEEWQPVGTFKYSEPEELPLVTDADMAGYGPRITIKDLCGRYVNGTPLKLESGWIKGQVISNDASGNIYRSLYIQDETGGIEIKTGRTNSSNEYRMGQWVYVKLGGLTLGMYGFKTGTYGGQGMIQLGLTDQSGAYETAYIDLPLIVDSHILKGGMGEPVVPAKLTVAQLPGKNDTQATNKYIGTLVELEGLKYGNEIFTLIYLSYSQDTKAATNRIFLTEQTWGITTWGLSKEKMGKLLEAGTWDEAYVGSGNETHGKVGDHRTVQGINGATYGDIERNAYSVSHYFKMGAKEIQVRSSGYARFADVEIDPGILSGANAVNFTGILTLYQGSIQFTLLDLDGVVKVQ